MKQIENRIKLSFEACIIEEERIWFTAFDHNGLYCKYNGSEEAVLEAVIPHERKYAFRLYAGMNKFGNRIFLTPFLADEAAVYDIEKKTVTKLPLKKVSEFGEKKIADENAKFWCSEAYGNFLFLFPHNYPALAIINMRTLETSYISDFIDGLELQSTSNEPYITDVCVENEAAYCSCACADAVVRVGFKDRKVTVWQVPANGKGFNGILKAGANIWLTPRVKGGVVCFDLERNTAAVYDRYPEGFSSSYVPFHTLYPFGKGVILIPGLSVQFVELDTQTGEMENKKYLSDLISGEKAEGIYSYDKTMAYSADGNIISFMSGKDYSFYRANIETGEICRSEFYITSVYPQKRLIALAAKSPGAYLVFGETETFGIRNYIESLEDLENLRDVKKTVLGGKGKELYEKLTGIRPTDKNGL